MPNSPAGCQWTWGTLWPAHQTPSTEFIVPKSASVTYAYVATASPQLPGRRPRSSTVNKEYPIVIMSAAAMYQELSNSWTARLRPSPPASAAPGTRAAASNHAWYSARVLSWPGAE